MKRIHESEIEWRERDYAQLRAWGRRLAIAGGVCAGIGIAVGALGLLMAEATSSYPKGAREGFPTGLVVLIAGMLVLAGLLWFAGQVLHIRAAVERNGR